jgi:hypothetical protein
LSSNVIAIGYYEVQSHLTKQPCIADYTLPQNIVQSSKSKRIRKEPVTGTNDFLWEG